MNVDGDELERGTPGQAGEQPVGLVERHAELVDLEAGRNMRMAPGVDVGVDANRHARHEPRPHRQRLDALELAGRFDVDRLQPERHRAFELGVRLADAGEDDVARRETGLAGQLDFPNRVRVGPGAQLAEQARDGQRRVGLERVVDAVGVVAEARVMSW